MPFFALIVMAHQCISPPNQEVFLHGLDEKIYENIDDIDIQTLFHKCRDEKMLLLKGCIVMKK